MGPNVSEDSCNRTLSAQGATGRVCDNTSTTMHLLDPLPEFSMPGKHTNPQLPYRTK